MGGWVGGKARLRIAYSNQKYKSKILHKNNKNRFLNALSNP
jgi:hypothetical protein